MGHARLFLVVAAVTLAQAFVPWDARGQAPTKSATTNQGDNVRQIEWEEGNSRNFYPPGEESDRWSECHTTAVLPHRSNANKKTTIQVHIRFHDPQAREVVLVWGLDGFKPAPEKLPPNTFLTYNRSHMNTTMNYDGDVFALDLEIPNDTRFDYGFTVVRDANDKEVKIWRGGRNQGYHTMMLTTANASEVIKRPSILVVRDYVLIAASVGVAAFFMVRLAWYAVHESDQNTPVE